MIFDAIDADYIKLRSDVKNGSFDSVYARQLKSVMPQLSVDDNLVYLDGSRILLPLQATKKILHLLHVSQIGMKKTYDLCRSMNFWPGMFNDVKQMITQCRPCNVHRNLRQKLRELGNLHQHILVPLWVMLASIYSSLGANNIWCVSTKAVAITCLPNFPL